LSRPTRSTHARSAAINASTVFAITLAIIAGLICAWVFKKVLLDKGPKPQQPVEQTFRLMVAGTNLYDGQPIKSTSLKRITVSKQKYDEAVAEGKKHGGLLEGYQAAGRVPFKALPAEKPIFEDQLKPYKYPVAVPSLVAEGKRAVIVPVDSKNVMVQVGDHVDIMCTLANNRLGRGNRATAVIARDAKCVARFNSTAPGAQPPRGNTRTYTLEVTPYRYALIELAKTVGGVFSLSSRGASGGESSPGAAAPVGAPAGPTEDPDVELVTTRDLAKLFGITDPVPERVFVIQRFNGLNEKPPLRYHDPRPPETPVAPLPGKGAGGSSGGVSKSNADSADKMSRTETWQKIGGSTTLAAASSRRNGNGNANGGGGNGVGGQPNVWRRLGNGPLLASASTNRGGGNAGAGNLGFYAPTARKNCST